MPARPAPPPRWGVDDVEAVTCCLCDEPGRPVYDLAPFALVRCPRCGLAFISPRLRPEAQHRVYDDVGYFEGGVYGDHRSMAMRLQRVWTAGRLDLLPPGTGRRLLEVGCGYGHFLAAARDRGYAVAGVELSRPATAHARDRLGLEVTQGQLGEVQAASAGSSTPAVDLTATPGATAAGRAAVAFDVIVAWDTLEHVPDPVAFLRVARDLLAPDGVLAFSTPYVSSWPARLLRERWWTLKPAEHIWHFTPEHHRLVFARAGLAVTRIVRNPLARANLGRLDSLVGLARAARDPA